MQASVVEIFRPLLHMGRMDGHNCLWEAKCKKLSTEVNICESIMPKIFSILPLAPECVLDCIRVISENWALSFPAQPLDLRLHVLCPHHIFTSFDVMNTRRMVMNRIVVTFCIPFPGHVPTMFNLARLHTTGSFKGKAASWIIYSRNHPTPKEGFWFTARCCTESYSVKLNVVLRYCSEFAAVEESAKSISAHHSDHKIT